MPTAIVQARMGSTRLPGKALMEICDKPLLWHIVRRVSYSKYISKIVIATSTNTKDDKIEKLANEYELNLFRGSEDDCLDRYYQTAKRYNADVVVRITADCPLICPEVIDKVISESVSYTHLTLPTN